MSRQTSAWRACRRLVLVGTEALEPVAEAVWRPYCAPWRLAARHASRSADTPPAASQALYASTAGAGGAATGVAGQLGGNESLLYLCERAWSRQRRSMRQSTWPGSWPRQASGRAERGVVRESLVDLVRLPLSPPIFPIALDYESPTTEIRSTTICPSAASPATSYVPRRYAAAVSAHSTASSWSASSGTEVDSGRPAM